MHCSGHQLDTVIDAILMRLCRTNFVHPLYEQTTGAKGQKESGKNAGRRMNTRFNAEQRENPQPAITANPKLEKQSETKRTKFTQALRERNAEPKQQTNLLYVTVLEKL